MIGTPKFKQIEVSAQTLNNSMTADFRLDLPFEGDWVCVPDYTAVLFPDGTVGYAPSQTGPVCAKINDQTSDYIVLANVADSGVAVFVGKVKTLFIRAVQDTTYTEPLILWVGKDCNIGFQGAVY
jgi:hypothetical protein